MKYRETKRKFWVRRGERMVNRYIQLAEAIGEATRLWTWDRSHDAPFTQLTVGLGEKTSRRTLWWNGRDIADAEHIYKREEKEYDVFHRRVESAS